MCTFLNQDNSTDYSAGYYQYKKELRDMRLNQYSQLDDRKYCFTINDFDNYLSQENFDIKKCSIKNIQSRRTIKQESKPAEDIEYDIKQMSDNYDNEWDTPVYTNTVNEICYDINYINEMSNSDESSDTSEYTIDEF